MAELPDLATHSNVHPGHFSIRVYQQSPIQANMGCTAMAAIDQNSIGWQNT